MSHFKSPLDAELAKHGRRYGLLVYYAQEAIKKGWIKHVDGPVPDHHEKNKDGLVYDVACVRCNLEKAIEHANRDGWVGLQWEGEVI